MANKNINVTLTRSPIGILPKHKDCLRGLGLRKIRQSVTLEDTPSVRGMINKISYLLNVQEAK